MCAKLVTLIFDGEVMGAAEIEADREEVDGAGEEEEGIIRGGAQFEDVLRGVGVGACDCPWKRGLGGSRSTGLGASSPLMGTFVRGCEGVCEADADSGTLVGAASVIGISMGAVGVYTPPASVCIGPTGADLYPGCGVRRS